MVFSIAYHFCGNSAIAEEIAQDVFLQLYDTQPFVASASHLVACLRRVTTHRCIDLTRRRQIRSEVAGGSDGNRFARHGGTLRSVDEHLDDRRIDHPVGIDPSRFTFIPRCLAAGEPVRIVSIARLEEKKDAGGEAGCRRAFHRLATTG
jgi:hypothetical protein